MVKIQTTTIQKSQWRLRKMERGIKLSKINAVFKQAIDLTPFLGKLQQHGLVKIVFDPAKDEEPFVQLTEKGRQEIIELWVAADSVQRLYGRSRRDQLNSLLVDLKNLIKELVENVQLFPMCDSCLKGKKMVGKPKKYEYKEGKDKIAYF